MHAYQIVGTGDKPFGLSALNSQALCETMGAKDVEDTLEMVRADADLDHVSVLHRPRRLSDLWSLLSLWRFEGASKAKGHRAHSGSTVSPDDPGQDGELSPLNEECDQASQLRIPLGALTSDWGVC